MTEEAASPATPGAPAAVRLEGVRKRFGYRETLRGVNLSVAGGECVAIFGHNGAGKSTLLRIVATQWRATGGSGRVFGLDIAREAVSVRRRLGVVFHQNFLRGELTLEENLRFYRDLYGLGAATDVADRAEQVGLGHRLRDRVETFSQGMAKRASIARSLLHDPDLWLLDEPFSGLDPQGRSLLCEMVRQQVVAGRTVLLATHQVDLGRELASRLITMEDGALTGEEVVR